MKEDWKTISLQLPETWLKKAQEKAEKETISLSAYIRKLILKDIEHDLSNKK